MPEPIDLDDLLDELRSPAISAPPASALRRRGDRRRTRRRAAVGTGLVAALAAVAVPLATAGDGRDGSGLTASDPSGGSSSPVTFLDYLDVARGMIGSVDRDDVLDPGPDPCLASAADDAEGSASGLLDVVGASVAQTEGARRRAVLSYEASRGARAVLSDLSASLPSCSRAEVLDQGATRLAYVVRTGSPDDGAGTLTRIVRIDDYLLVDSADLLGAGSTTAVQATLASLDRQAEPVEADLRAMGSRPAPTDLLLPAGIGPVGLGIGADALDDLGAVRYEDGPTSECRRFAVTVDGRSVEGLVGPDEVEEVSFSGTRTPAGIGVGSTLAGVRAAYPRADVSGTTARIPAEPGHERDYVLTLSEGRVVDAVLALADDTCR